VPAGTTSTPVLVDQTCSDVLTGSGTKEPDEATLSCFCTAALDANLATTAKDKAKFLCETPGLTVKKTCAVQDPTAKTNAVTVEVMNTSPAPPSPDGVSLANCVATDNVFTGSPTCQGTGASTAVRLTCDVTSVAPGEMA